MSSNLTTTTDELITLIATQIASGTITGEQAEASIKSAKALDLCRLIEGGTIGKVTRFTAGAHTFTPDPLAIMTKIEVQAAGGSGGRTSDVAFTNGCGLGSGGNEGNFYSVVFEHKLTVPSINIVVGDYTNPPLISGNGIAGANSVVEDTIIAGGAGGRNTTGTTAAVIYRSAEQTLSTINWGTLGTYKEMLNITGAKGTSPWIPRQSDHNFLQGGDGGSPVWGSASRSNKAKYSGSRIGYVSINEDGTGYGYGGCGIAKGNRTPASGNRGGPGLTVITEYF